MSAAPVTDADERRARRRATQRAWYAKNRDRVTAYRRERHSGRDDVRAKARAYYDANKEQILAQRRDRHREARYGLSPADFDALLAQQGGRCAICLTGDPGQRGWQVDHDHACCPTTARSCGRCVRGILCFLCNSALGKFGDDPDRLRRAIAYLERVVTRGPQRSPAGDSAA